MKLPGAIHLMPGIQPDSRVGAALRNVPAAIAETA
jgi:hypothetical protein